MKPKGLSGLKFEAFKNLLLSETVLEITQSSRRMQFIEIVER